MIIWQSGGDAIDLGTLETRRCETCEKDRPFNVVLHYRYWGIYWVFNFVTKKEYTLLCDVCHRGWELDRKKVEGIMESVPIPFMRRCGCLVFTGFVVALILFGWLVGH